MTSFLRPLAYRYRWIYDTVTAVSSLSVGGVERLRGLGLEAVQPHLKPGASVLDLCCGSCLLYTSPSPRDKTPSRMPSSA